MGTKKILSLWESIFSAHPSRPAAKPAVNVISLSSIQLAGVPQNQSDSDLFVTSLKNALVRWTCCSQ
jgi:hypothetical protein